jgi:two-component system phosphate regulon sensor histidine kinase PhoR
MLDRMDGLVIAFIAIQGILLAIAIGVVFARGRVLREIDELTRTVGGAGGDLQSRIRRLVQQAAAAEWELGQQVENADHLADLMGVGILRLGDDMVIQTANRAAHVLLGRQPGSMVGRTAIEAFVDHRVEEVVVAARDTGSGVGEFRLAQADGPVLVVRASRSPIRGIWVVLEDVSELRRLQQIRAEFIDNLSHELRTPLSTVSLLAETLARDAEAAGSAVPAKMRDRIGKIEVETGHLVQMVNELLDLARIESGGPLVLLDDVDLGQVAAESTERLRLFADRQGVSLAVAVDDPVPPVRGDEQRLGQVLVNLLHNAVKFSHSGGEVVVRVNVVDGEVVVSVADHGVGIPAPAQARIFERFYKVDQARVRGGGTGLGLAIARHVVEQHGGRIWVESQEGVGSTFSFRLPRSSSAAASPAA